MTRRLVFQVYVGPRRPLFDVCTESVHDYARAIGADYELLTEPLLRIKPGPLSNRSESAMRLGYLPIFEKWNALGHLRDYDQVAVIDADVWARPPSRFYEKQNIFEADAARGPLAACFECDMPMLPHYRQKLRDYSRMQYRELTDVEWGWEHGIATFFNAGVMVLGQDLRDYPNTESPRSFLEQPDFQRFIDGRGHWKWSTDQTLINWWVRSAGVPVGLLPWHWNALYTAIPDERAREAHFVHFFLHDHLPDKGTNTDELIRQVS